MRQISIHALLAESDTLQAQTSCWLMLDYFYPRSPCGERPLGVEPKKHNTEISIHALLAESDPASQTKLPGKIIISIHALLAESDHPIGVLVRVVEISIHALLAESDRTL